jgi:hypothetical protein
LHVRLPVFETGPVIRIEHFESAESVKSKLAVAVGYIPSRFPGLLLASSFEK